MIFFFITLHPLEGWPCHIFVISLMPHFPWSVVALNLKRGTLHTQTYDLCAGAAYIERSCPRHLSVLYKPLSPLHYNADVPTASAVTACSLCVYLAKSRLHCIVIILLFGRKYPQTNGSGRGGRGGKAFLSRVKAPLGLHFMKRREKGRVKVLNKSPILRFGHQNIFLPRNFLFFRRRHNLYLVFVVYNGLGMMTIAK